MISEKFKMLAKIIIGLLLIQGARVVIKLIVFCFVEKSQFTDTIVSALFMAAMAFVGIIIAGKKGVSLSFLPAKHKAIYTIVTVVAMALLVSTPFITGDKSFFAVAVLIYAGVITPIFEELIFRGYLWNKLEEKFGGRFAAYIITTLLFAVWHLGYIDTVAFRMTSGSLAFAMLMKVVTGLFFGIVLGAVRYKTKNCYSTIILHGVMNIFGR